MSINVFDKIAQMKKELFKANYKLSNINSIIAIFGSARIPPHHPYYRLTENIAKLLSNNGYSIMTGGGFGLMEAANKGAKEGISVGLNIQLPLEPHGNKYQNISVNFNNFSTRKMAFVYYSSAFVVMPGGFGTLDELFEVLTLMQTKKIINIPVILVDSVFWGGLISWFKEKLLKLNLISKENFHLFHFVDYMHETVDYIKKHIPTHNNRSYINKSLKRKLHV